MKNKIIGATTLLVLLSNLLLSCSFFNSINDDDPVIIPQNETKITSLSLGKTSMTTSVGSMEYISVSVKPANLQKDVKLTWNYDSSIIDCDTSSSWGVTIKAIAEGQTTLRCSAGGYDATCLITVSGIAEGYEVTTEPYIYSNYSILQTSPGVSEKVFVSLYGGDAGDIDGYNWSVDNSSIIGIQPTGQYCVITAKESGYARIKITHNKATYPYYMGVYVFADNTNVSYITTTNNIVTMNQEDGDKPISVSLINGKDSSKDSQFSWEVITEENSPTPIALSWNGNNAVISPKQSGSCTIRVTHPDATYPLDILCRVITVIKNVYIQPDTTVVTLSGMTEQTVTSNLVNLNIGEYNLDGFQYTLDDYNVAEIVSSIGNQVTLRGVANGSCKLIISHEKAAYAREVLLIVNGQLKDAVDASCYITTSQNYIRTKVGASGQTINISLKGGEDGDEAGFQWSVKSTAADGSNSRVINLETATGSVFHTATRAVMASYSYGSAYIEPLYEGTAVITITHPKILYPTEILVKVLNKDAIIEEPLYFVGSGLMRILNGSNQDYTVQLKGSAKTASDDQDIKWSCDNSKISIAPSGNNANVSAPPMGTGCTTSKMNISHKKADNSKQVLILTADDEKTLMSMKALYSDKTYYNLESGETATVTCNAVGFDTDSTTAYDYSLTSWTVKDSSIIYVEKNVYNPLSCSIKALKSGTTILTASLDGYSCDFSITVYPEGTIALDPEVYFTTTQNVISLSGAGKTFNANINAINLKANKYSDIEWISEDSSVASVVSNGTKAVITANKEGETVINVSHPESQNILKIYVRIGSEYVIKDADPVVYISSDDVMTFLRDDPAGKLQAVLVNFTGEDSSGFTFEIDNPSIATITAQSGNGTAYIKPVGCGQSEITISHPATELTKKVLVVVGNSSEELAGITYLTTNSNVVAVGEGNSKSVSVSVKNASSPIVDGYTWSSSNPGVIDIVPSGATAVLKGNSIGTALITVSNKACKYSLTIIAQCVDPIAAANSPYIQLSSSVLTLTVSSSYTSLTADLVGGTSEDYSNFVWQVNDTSVCAVYGQNEVGKLRALKSGQTYVTVTHPKAAYSAQILVVCEDAIVNDCYITVPASLMTIKPNASSQTITASLVNGTTTDKYSFNWSLDVYDVIDVQYSANVCTITPKQTGTATITISHPKAAYDQQIIVNVQEYSSFAFPEESVSLTQGTVSFLNMQVPTTSVTTHVEYSVENEKICSVTGTKSVAQLTGITPGTTTVRAKLVATSTGVVQASAELLVYVKEAKTNAVYITSSSTIYTVNKGKSQTLSATVSGTGITSGDQYNLKWYSSDSDVVQITGISSDGTVTGQSIYITALKPGEALITCSHEKAASTLQFYVVVPGTAEKVVTLSKTYITLVKGSSGTALKANIENAEGNSDYNNLIWSCEGANGVEVARIMGSGQAVTVYPLTPGEATVMAQLPDSSSIAKCTVVVEAGKSLTFETNSRKVQPFHSKVVNYKVSPPDALLTWTMAQDDDYFEYKDLGCDENGNGQVEISGIKEGSGVLACVTDGSAKAQCTVKVAWDYEFDVAGSTTFSIEPTVVKKFDYKVSPVDSIISVESTDIDTVFTSEIVNNGNGSGTVIITPITESPNNVSIKIVAKNPNKSNEVVGSKTLTAKFQYAKLTPVISLVSQNGKYSRFQNDTLIIGDGENVEMKFDVKESKVNGYVSKVEFIKSDNTANFGVTEKADTSVYKLCTISDLNPDTIVNEYKINELYVPVVGGVPLGELQMKNVYYSPVHESHSTCYNAWRFIYNGTILARWSYHDGNHRWQNGILECAPIYNVTIQKDDSYKGKRYSIAEFQANNWFYCPYLGWNAGGSCGDGLGHEVYIEAHVNRSHVNASLVPTLDETVQNYKEAGYLQITFIHNGKTEISRTRVPVYYEVRNCAMK